MKKEKGSKGDYMYKSIRGEKIGKGAGGNEKDTPRETTTELEGKGGKEKAQGEGKKEINFLGKECITLAITMIRKKPQAWCEEG